MAEALHNFTVLTLCFLLPAGSSDRMLVQVAQRCSPTWMSSTSSAEGLLDIQTPAFQQNDVFLLIKAAQGL